MPRSFKFPITDINNLQMHLYTIGYPTEGEAILSVICENNKVLFISLTDCYEHTDNDKNHYNHINPILAEYGNPPINVFIWTHPDKDHSVGITTILERYDPNHNALVYLPSALDKDNKFDICDEAQYAFRYLSTYYNTGRKYNIIPVGLDDDEARSLCKLQFEQTSTLRTITCSFIFLAPFSTLLLRRSVKSEKDFVINDMSIVYAMKFNGFNFLFCGDLAQQSIQFLNNTYLHDMYYIKIPHHGSDQPKGFIGKIVDNQVENPVSTTTVFQNNLPRTTILNEYKKLGYEVYCTGRGNEKFGCIKTIFNISDFTKVTSFSGNAYKLE